MSHTIILFTINFGVTFLRWVLLIPAATAGGSLGLAIGILFAVIGKIFNNRLNGDEAFPMILLVFLLHMVGIWQV